MDVGEIIEILICKRLQRVYADAAAVLQPSAESTIDMIKVYAIDGVSL